MTTQQIREKAQKVADAIQANCDEYAAKRISYTEWGRRQRALWASVEPKTGPFCGRKYPVLDRVTNLVCGRDIDYGYEGL